MKRKQANSKDLQVPLLKDSKYIDPFSDCGLKEVYLISLLGFVLTGNASGHYLRKIALTDTDTGEGFYSKLGYKFIELPNFVKTEAELVTDIDKWIYLLKNLSRLKRSRLF